METRDNQKSDLYSSGVVHNFMYTADNAENSVNLLNLSISLDMTP